MTGEERATVERFVAHAALTDRVIKEALRVEKAGDEATAKEIVCMLADFVRAQGKQS